jgi:hypothetical protein
MKKAVFTGLALGILSVGLVAGSAMATSITYIDHTIDFPGYNTGFGDEQGSPQVASMTVNYDDTSKLLQSVVINMTNRLAFDSLFINNDSENQGWDFMIRDNSNANNSSLGGLGNQLFGVQQAAGGLYSVAENYTYSLVPTGSNGGSRTGHPYSIEADDLTFINNTLPVIWSGTTLTYDFSSFAINLGDSFNIAYAPWCANDVIMVPEPSTMLLFGAGLAGLAGIVTRRKKD